MADRTLSHPRGVKQHADEKVETESRPSSPSGALTLRSLVSTKEAGVIIGKGGKNVAELREQTGVKAGVSKVVPGVHERVLSVSGSVEGVAKVNRLGPNNLVFYSSFFTNFVLSVSGIFPHYQPTT
jgi:KH domain